MHGCCHSVVMGPAEYSDEDVVLPNSPLYEHLKETGFEDPYHDESSKYSLSQESSHHSQRTSSFNSFGNKIEAFILKLINSVCYLAADVLGNFFIPEAKVVQSKFSNEILRTVLDSDLLIEEDITFLKAYTSDGYDRFKYGSDNKLWLIKRAAPPMLLLITTLFLAYNAPICFNLEESSFMLMEKFWGLICTISAFLLTVYFLRILLFMYFDMKSNSTVKKLKNICMVLKELALLFKKCIRIIQEAELIARGFTLVSVSGLAQRLELSVDLPVLKPNRQYPAFRKSLFSWLKSLFIKHKEASLAMIDCLPLSASTDCFSHYFATLDLEDYGDILNLDLSLPDDLNKLLEVSDSFSISCLKSILQLTKAQISEYLKLVYLCAHYIFKQRSVQNLFEFRKMLLLDDVLADLLKYGDGLLSDIQEIHKYYQSIEVSTHMKDDVPFPESDNSSFSNLKINVHSLSLHLKAALKRVIDLEEILHSEELNSKDLDDPAVQTILKDKVSCAMSFAKAELESSEDCLLNSCEKLNSLFSQKTGENEPLAPVMENPPVVPLMQPMPVIPTSDPVPEDEVFEAFITGSKPIVEENNQSSDLLEMEMKQHKENEASSRMMRELRVVLAVKAEEHKVREQLALNLKYGKVDCTESDKQDNDVTEVENENKCCSSDEKSSACTSSVGQTQSDFDNSSDIHDTHDDKSEETSLGPSKFHLGNLCDFEGGETSDVLTNDSKENLGPSDSNAKEEGHKYNYYPSMGQSFASSIATLAAQRSMLLGLNSETFAGDSESDSDESCG